MNLPIALFVFSMGLLMVGVLIAIVCETIHDSDCPRSVSIIFAFIASAVCGSFFIISVLFALGFFTTAQQIGANQ